MEGAVKIDIFDFVVRIPASSRFTAQGPLSGEQSCLTGTHRDWAVLSDRTLHFDTARPFRPALFHPDIAHTVPESGRTAAPSAGTFLHRADAGIVLGPVCHCA